MKNDIEFTEIEDIIGELVVPCDYDRLLQCGPAPAEWEMRAACQCGAKAVRLVCPTCKDGVLASDRGLSCGDCGAIHAPARHLFWLVEKL